MPLIRSRWCWTHTHAARNPVDISLAREWWPSAANPRTHHAQDELGSTVKEAASGP